MEVLLKEVKKKYGHMYDDTGTKLKPLDTDSQVTKRVKKHYNEMSDADFRKKYGVTKQKYAERVMKHKGDPYKNGLNAKIGRKLLADEVKKEQKIIDELNSEIAYLSKHSNGVYDKRGNMLKSPDEVFANQMELMTYSVKHQDKIHRMLKREGFESVEEFTKRR